MNNGWTLQCTFSYIQSLFYYNNKMSKTAIDFFSKGLDHNKTKLSVSVFDLNIKHQEKETVFRKKANLTHLNFHKLDKKQSLPQKQHSMRQYDSYQKQEKLGTTMSSFATVNTSPIKQNLLKFEGGPFYNQQISQSDLTNHITTLRQPRIKKKLNNISPNKFGSTPKNICKEFPKITEECSVHQASFNSSIDSPEILPRSQKKGNQYFSRMSEGQRSKKNYFIRNLVLQNYPQIPQKNAVERYSSQKKFAIRKIPSTIPKLQQIDIKTTTLLSLRKEQTYLPNSLKAYRISYNSSHEKNSLDIAARKEKYKKSVLIPNKPKIARKNIKQIQYGIDRWEYNRQQAVGWEI